MKAILPDFKTERPNVAPPLPGILRLVPVGFYLGILGTLAMAAYSYHRVKEEKAETDRLRQDTAVQAGRIQALDAQQQALDAESKQAGEVQRWISGSTEIYPIILKIARTVDPDTSISELTLARLEDNPSHLKMSLKLHSPRGAEQAEILTQAIADSLNLRPYSPSTTPSDTDKEEAVLECNWAPAVALNNDDK